MAPRWSSTTTSSRPRTSRARPSRHPGLANTQDVALKFWLKEQGYDVDPDGTGRRHRRQPGQQPHGPARSRPATSTAPGCRSRTPRSWSPRAAELVDEADLWPDGQFVTTHLLVNNDFLEEHPDLVDDLLAGQIEANNYIADNSDEAKTAGRRLHRGPHRQRRSRRRPRLRLGHSSPSPTTRSPTRCIEERRTRCRRRPARADRRPGRHLRPRPTQQAARRRGRAGSVRTIFVTITSHAGAGPRSHRLRAPAIRIKGVSKTFGRGADFTVALKEVDLDVAEREFLCIVGASGCGKSTLLNLIAGPRPAEHRHHRHRWPQGRVHVPGGHAVPVAHRRPERRPGAEAARHAQGRSARTRVEELLELVHLGGRQHKRPHELSGGMRQRTAAGSRAGPRGRDRARWTSRSPRSTR